MDVCNWTVRQQSQLDQRWIFDERKPCHTACLRIHNRIFYFKTMIMLVILFVYGNLHGITLVDQQWILDGWTVNIEWAQAINLTLPAYE